MVTHFILVVNPLSARCGVYSTWKHVPRSSRAKSQVAVNWSHFNFGLLAIKDL